MVRPRLPERSWLAEIERRLKASRLPPVYIRRFMDELADHFLDLMEEDMSDERNLSSIASRLGRADQVAAAAIDSYRNRDVFVRHPWAKVLFFGVSPAVVMVLAFVLACLSVGAFTAICQKCGVRLADGEHLGRVGGSTLNWAVSLVTTILPAVVLTVCYCLTAKRWKISTGWTLASCCLLAIVAMLPVQSILLSDLPGNSRWSIGLCLPPNLTQLVQLIAPLSVGLYCTWKCRNATSSCGTEGTC